MRRSTNTRRMNLHQQKPINVSRVPKGGIRAYLQDVQQSQRAQETVIVDVRSTKRIQWGNYRPPGKSYRGMLNEEVTSPAPTFLGRGRKR